MVPEQLDKRANYFQVLGEPLLTAGEYEEAIEAFKKGLDFDPNYGPLMWVLAISYTLSGREKEAKPIVEEFFMRNPSI